MIINSHVHINPNENCFFYNSYGMKQFLTEMHSSGITMAFPTLNPKLEIFRCPNDCSFSCVKKETNSIVNGELKKGDVSIQSSEFSKNLDSIAVNNANNNLQNCNCSSPNRHRVCVEEKNGKAVLRCRTCGMVILESSIDPLRKYNISLIEMTRPYRAFVKPLLYLLLCPSTLQNEIEFFEKNYAGEFTGFKLHPWNDQVSVADFRIQPKDFSDRQVFKHHSISPFNSTISYNLDISSCANKSAIKSMHNVVKTSQSFARTFLIHTGTRGVESPENAIEFAKKNPEANVVIAHAAVLKGCCLKEIALMENVFIDCCPAGFMFKSKDSSLENPSNIMKPEDIYYKALDFLPTSKILFGTDSPWGNSEEELAIVRNLKVPEKVRNQILFENALRVYGIIRLE